MLSRCFRSTSKLFSKASNARLLCHVPSDHVHSEEVHSNEYTGVKLDADFDNPKWIKRHRHMFHFLDPNHNNKISLDEIIFKASEEICTKIGASPEQNAAHTEAVKNFWMGVGLRMGVETEWPEYIRGWEELSLAELEKWKNNEPTLIRKWGDALFDIIDADGSQAIDYEEWKLYTICAGVCVDEEDCQKTFDVCDRNGDGKIEVHEMTRQHVGFWYTGDPNSDGLYGSSVP